MDGEDPFQKHDRFLPKKSHKVSDVRAYEEEQQIIEDDWENLDPVAVKEEYQDPLILNLQAQSEKIEETLKKNRRVVQTNEELLNPDEDPNQTQLRKTKVDWVLMGAIFMCAFLFWLIFLRR